MSDTPLNRTFTNILDTSGTLRARAHQGLNASPIGLARVVALAIGISLSIATPLDAQASDKAIGYVKELARYQLTDKQEACHHEIIYRESRWNHRAVGNIGGQFWMYWHYVAHRYGHTEYDEPNYCGALHHLKTKGWQ